jgi:hypothetical protein
VIAAAAASVSEADRDEAAAAKRVVVALGEYAGVRTPEL